MNSNVFDKSLMYGFFLYLGNYFLYPYFNLNETCLDSLIFSFDYWLSNELFNNFIENYFEKSFIKTILSTSSHCLLYWLSYNLIFYNKIKNLPNNNEYKSWYVMFFWIITMKYLIDSNNNIIKKVKYKFYNIKPKEIFNFIDNNYNNVLKTPSFLPDNLPVLQKNYNENHYLEFFNDLQNINTNNIGQFLTNVYEIIINKDNANIMLNSEIEIKMVEYLNILEYNFKTYYHRVLVPFVFETLKLLKTIINLSWNIITYFKNYLPEEVQFASDFMSSWNSFWFGVELANDNATFYDKVTKTFSYTFDNLVEWIPYFNQLSLTYNSIETGMNYYHWSKYFKEFYNETNIFMKKCYKAEKYYKFIMINSPKFPISKHKKNFLDKNK